MSQDPVAIVFDKEELRAKLLEVVREDLATLIRTQNDAQEGATHSENRAEHSKDTRATEQSYLARGLADRVEALRETEARLQQIHLPTIDPDEPIEPYAIATLRDEESDEIQAWWLLPIAGGLEIEHAGVVVRTVTPGSPLGKALIGLMVEESGTFRTPRGERGFTIIAVS